MTSYTVGVERQFSGKRFRLGKLNKLQVDHIAHMSFAPAMFGESAWKDLLTYREMLALGDQFEGKPVRTTIVNLAALNLLNSAVTYHGEEYRPTNPPESQF